MSLMSKIIETTFDLSSIDSKVELLEKCGYFKRNMWEYENNTKYVLKSDDEYKETLLCKKTFLKETKEYNEKRQKTITTSLYAMPNNTIMAVVKSVAENNDERSKRDSFISVYVLLNSEVHQRNNDNSVKDLELIQLLRYDPTDKFSHLNDLEKIINDDEYTLYNKYFKEKAETPHFHFASRSNAENYKTSTSLAINLFSLMEYVLDLRNGKVSEEFDLGMPYVKIKNNPSLYKTQISEDVKNLLRDTLSNKANVDMFINSGISSKTINNILAGNQGEIEGLDAVFIDLISLACLYKTNEQNLSEQLELALKIIGGDDIPKSNIKEDFGNEL